MAALADSCTPVGSHIVAAVDTGTSADNPSLPCPIANIYFVLAAPFQLTSLPVRGIPRIAVGIPWIGHVRVRETVGVRRVCPPPPWKPRKPRAGPWIVGVAPPSTEASAEAAEKPAGPLPRWQVAEWPSTRPRTRSSPTSTSPTRGFSPPYFILHRKLYKFCDISHNYAAKRPQVVPKEKTRKNRETAETSEDHVCVADPKV